MEFLPRLLPLAITKKKGRMVGDIVAHLCWENEHVSKSIISCTISGLEENDFDGVRPYFRSLMRILLLSDSVQSKRVDWISQSFLQTIQQQSQFWKITDFCIEHLIRMIKKNPLVLQWAQKHPNHLDTLLTWIANHAEPPAPYRHDNRSDIQLTKPQQQHGYQQQASYNTHYGAHPRQKYQFLEAVKNGKELEAEGGSDSDVDFSDRELKMGQWVDCFDTSSNWLCASIVRVDGIKVEVHFDGWSDKWNEVLEMSNNRIRNLGTYTTKEQMENRGKPRKSQN